MRVVVVSPPLENARRPVVSADPFKLIRLDAGVGYISNQSRWDERGDVRASREAYAGAPMVSLP
jgi:hypothetical protein